MKTWMIITESGLNQVDTWAGKREAWHQNGERRILAAECGKEKGLTFTICLSVRAAKFFTTDTTEQELQPPQICENFGLHIHFLLKAYTSGKRQSHL